MNTCKTCKWWDVELPQGESPKRDGSYGTPIYRECLHPKLDGNDVDDFDGAQAASIDGYSEIRSGPDFGCIHHDLA